MAARLSSHCQTCPSCPVGVQLQKTLPAIATCSAQGPVQPRRPSLCRYLQGWTFMSCEGPMKGIRKPDPRCWDIARGHLGVDASQLVLVDDRKENCESAAAAGLHAIHSTDAASTRQRLRELSII